jgi:hypothetical protein
MERNESSRNALLAIGVGAAAVFSVSDFEFYRNATPFPH